MGGNRRPNTCGSSPDDHDINLTHDRHFRRRDREWEKRRKRHQRRANETNSRDSPDSQDCLTFFLFSYSPCLNSFPSLDVGERDIVNHPFRSAITSNLHKAVTAQKPHIAERDFDAGTWLELAIMSLHANTPPGIRSAIRG